MTDRKTNALVRRAGDAKASRRKPVLLDAQETAWAHARRERYYCPGCGQVRARRDNWGIRQLSGDRVLPHEFNTGVREVELCPGGPIDPKGDRAP
jgi:hypothetical protein